jgi:hypothetical protein
LFDPLPTSFEHVKAWKVRALIIASAMRWEALPDLPTVSQFVPGCEARGWFGVGAPKDTLGRDSSPSPRTQQIIRKFHIWSLKHHMDGSPRGTGRRTGRIAATAR